MISLRLLNDLGWINVMRVAVYRVLLRLGIHPAQRISGKMLTGPFLILRTPLSNNKSNVINTIHRNKFKLFSWFDYIITDEVPNWFINQLNGQIFFKSTAPWWKIKDFDDEFGDIKCLWEISRFDWVVLFAQNASIGDVGSHQQLEYWLSNWCSKNPPYKGPNWKCGQEASIRVLNLYIAALILDNINDPTEQLVELISQHLARIVSTIQYGIAQDNNHGTSEAAAIFIGGAWLHSNGFSYGEKLMNLGRQLLENRVIYLIGEDGTFSQYSLNYHRLMLDTISMVEICRSRFDLPEFSEKYLNKARLASNWLYNMICPETGFGPNVGANDGALLLNFGGLDYCDYRPSVQLSCALFSSSCAYQEDGTFNNGLRLLGIKLPMNVLQYPSGLIADDGGFAMLRICKTFAMMRYPRFRFRPSHADLLHVDFWHDGVNLLCDDGTYSYNPQKSLETCWGRTCNHNTVEFDGRDQMTREGRFLWKEWCETDNIMFGEDAEKSVSFGAGYKDQKGCSHFRYIQISNGRLLVKDRLDGSFTTAILRWRLPVTTTNVLNGKNNTELLCEGDKKYFINVRTLDCEHSYNFVKGWQSRYYFNKIEVNVLEISVNHPCEIVTEVFVIDE